MNKRKMVMIVAPVVVIVGILSFLLISGKIKFKADTAVGSVTNTATATYTTTTGTATVQSNTVSIPVQLGEPTY